MPRLFFVLFSIGIYAFSSSTSDDIVYEYRKPNLGIYLAEGGASFLVGNVVGIGVPILLANSFPLGDDPTAGYYPSLTYLLLYPVIYPFTSAVGIDITAKIFKCKGSYWGAVGGGVLGVGLGLGSCIIFRDESMQLYGWSLMVILPPLFATTGYNLFKKKELSQSNLLLHQRYISAQPYAMERISISKFPKISIKIIEFKF